MSDGQLFYQLPTFTLAGAGCSIGDTSVILSSMQDADGNQVQMANLGSKSWITLEPGNSSQEEQISFTGITVNANGTVTLTGVKNVAFKSPYTETAGVQKTHPGGAKAIVSNTSAFYDNLTSKDNDETINGVYTFTQSPIVPDPTTAFAVANKEYVDGVAIAGAAKATNTVFGISKLSVAAVTGSVPIVVGDNDPRVSPVSLATLTASQVAALAGDSPTAAVPSATNTFVTAQGFQRNQENYVVSTGTSAAFVLTLSPTPVALIAGMQVSFKSSVANQASPTLNVNSLGAKSLVKTSSTGTTVLVAGDISTNVLILAEYNGNEWQMMSPVANTPTPLNLGIDVVKSVANFDAAGRYALAQTTNSSVPTITTGGLQINNAGSGAGSSSFQWSILSSSSDTVFTVGAKFGARFSAPSVLSTNVANMYFGLGALTVTSNLAIFTGDHIGFKVVIASGVATLFGTIGQGAAESVTSALTTLAVNDSVDGFFVINSGSVDFYYRKNGGTFTGPTTVTTTLPTSSSLVAMGFAGVGTWAANFTSTAQSMNYER